MQELIRALFKRLSEARYIEIPRDGIEEAQAYLEKADTMYLRGLGRQLRNANTLVITVIDRDEV